jgi:hypothetical protein
MKARIFLPAVGLAVVLVAVPALAHHSFTTFWHMDQNAEITGVIKSVKIVNPHGELTVEVTEPNGEKNLWYITSRGPAQATRRAGWESGKFVGETVTIEGFPSRKEGARALAAGKVTFEDGTVMWLGGGGGVPGQ